MQLRLHDVVEQRPAAAGNLSRDGVRASAGGANERFHDSFGGGGLGCCARVPVQERCLIRKCGVGVRGGGGVLVLQESEQRLACAA